MKKTTLISIFLLFTIVFVAFLGLFLLTEKNLVFAGDYGLTEAQQIPGIAKGTIPQYVGGIINAVVAILGSILVALIIYGGVMYMTSAGNEKRTESGKNILTYAIIGIAIVMASYIISSFVLKALSGGGAATTTPEGEVVDVTEEHLECSCTYPDKSQKEFRSDVPSTASGISTFQNYCQDMGGVYGGCSEAQPH